MKIENLVKKFLADEKFTLRNTMVYGGLGLSKTSGGLNDVVTDIAFNGHPYTEERKRQVAEQLGEMMFYWHVLALTCEISPDEIVQQYVNMYLVKNNQLSVELNASILELMKHVKTNVKVSDDEIKRKRDEEKKKRVRDLMDELTK